MVKEWVKIPVIGNGDVLEPSLALKMKNQTGCDGVMLGRGAVGTPWIFKQILDDENGLGVYQPHLDERRAFIMEHFHLLSLLRGEQSAARAMRGLLLWYTKGLPHSSLFRGDLTSIKNNDTLITALDHYFSRLGGAGS